MSLLLTRYNLIIYIFFPVISTTTTRPSLPTTHQFAGFQNTLDIICVVFSGIVSAIVLFLVKDTSSAGLVLYRFK